MSAVLLPECPVVSSTHPPEEVSPPMGLEALVRAIGRGDHEALAALYDLTSPLVYRVVSRVLRDPADADEVTADVYLKVWRSAGTYDRRRGAVEAWLVVMARCRAIDRLRAKQVRRDGCHASANDHDVPWAGPAPDAALAADETSRQVRGALAQVPPGERQLITLAFFGGLTHDELAKRLGLPLGTVKTRIRRGLQALRRALQGTGGERPWLAMTR